MQELRFVAVSEDGQYAVLAVPGRSARFTLPIDERLRAVALGQSSRLAQYEIEVESPLRPKEIQARIRAGETVEEIADAAGVAVERVRWFEGPVLAERAYIAEQAQSAAVRRPGDAIPSSPAPRLGEIVAERLNTCGADPGDAQWDAKKLGDGSWQVQLAFISGGRLHMAEWIFDPRRRHVLPADDNAARMSLPGAEPPLPAAPPPGEATVTHLAPRLSTAAGHGGPGQGGPGLGAPGYGGAVGNGGMGNGGRARHERPGGGRPAVPEPGGLGPAAAEPRAHEAAKAEAPPAAHAASDVPPANPANPVGPVGQAPRAPRVPNAPEPGRGDPGRVTQPGRGAQAGAGPRAGAAPQSRAVPQSGAVPQAARDHRDAHARPESATAAAAPRRGEAEVPAGLESAASSSAEAVTATPGSSAEAASEQAARPARKAARGRRSSVPSWDEIMFGNSRQRD